MAEQGTAERLIEVATAENRIYRGISSREQDQVSKGEPTVVRGVRQLVR